MRNAPVSSLVAIFVFLAMAAPAYAYSAAYVARDPAVYNTAYKSMLEQVGFTVDIIDSDYMNSTNLSGYSLLFVGDENFPNPAEIPVNRMRSMVINGRSFLIKAWGLAKSSSVIASSQPIKGYKRLNNQITAGLPDVMQLHTQAKSPSGSYLQSYYLSRLTKDFDVKSVISTDSDTNDVMLGIVANGSVLRNNAVQNGTLCYFGVFNDAYWTNYSMILFSRCAKYAAFGLDNDSDGFGEVIDCNDNNPAISPNATEMDDCIDNNCNGIIDEGFDNDIDLFTPICGMDCNDFSANVYPGALELEDGLDNDCDSIIDEGTNLYDDDLDGYTEQQGDCNDNSIAINPGALETCNAIDDNCNAITDEEGSVGCAVYYYDGDGDSYGADAVKCLCAPFGSYNSGRNSDCDDANFYVNPAMPEIEGNGIDDDCNLSTRDGGPIPPSPVNVSIRADTNNIEGNNVILEWQHPEQGLSYNIYASDDYRIESFNLLSPFATTADNAYIDATASSAGKRFYLVKSAIGANLDNNTVVLGKFDIRLFRGQNLISLPLIPANDSIAAVLHQDSSVHPISEVLYISNSGERLLSSFNPSGYWESSNSLTAMRNGLGYFVNSNVSFFLTITGFVPEASQQMDIRNGFNLVGYTSLEERNVSDIIVQQPFNYSVFSIYKRREDGSYASLSFINDEAYQPWWSADGLYTLKPGTGYWFEARNNATIVYAP